MIIALPMAMMWVIFSIKLNENALKKMFPDAVCLFLIEVGFQSDCSEPVEQQLLNEICWQLQFHISCGRNSTTN